MAAQSPAAYAAQGASAAAKPASKATVSLARPGGGPGQQRQAHQEPGRAVGVAERGQAEQQAHQRRPAGRGRHAAGQDGPQGQQAGEPEGRHGLVVAREAPGVDQRDARQVGGTRHGERPGRQHDRGHQAVPRREQPAPQGVGEQQRGHGEGQGHEPYLDQAEPEQRQGRAGQQREQGHGPEEPALGAVMAAQQVGAVHARGPERVARCRDPGLVRVDVRQAVEAGQPRGDEQGHEQAQSRRRESRRPGGRRFRGRRGSTPALQVGRRGIMPRSPTGRAARASRGGPVGRPCAWAGLLGYPCAEGRAWTPPPSVHAWP